MAIIGISEILILVVGVAYGYVNPDQDERKSLLKKAAIYGLVLGILLGILERIFFSTYIVILTIIVSIVFTLGVFIGDILRKR